MIFVAKKDFKFQYYFINVFDGDKKQQTLFNFAPFITKFLGLSKSNHVININDFKAKIEKIGQVQERFIHINFVKMIDKALPKKVYADDRESLDIEFKDDEYLGTDVHILYDMNNKVLMIQKTRESLSIQNIAYYLNEFAHKLKLLDNNQVIDILPIYDGKILSANSIIKKIDLRFANIENVKSNEYNNMLQILSVFNKFNAISGCITMSVGRTRKELDNGEVMDAVKIVKQLKETYKNCVSSAKVSYVENDNSFSYDLFDDIMNDIGRIEVSPRESIKFEDVESEMLRLYNKKLPHLNNVIGYK